MKNSIKMVLVVLTIVMSFIAVQAFAGEPYGTKGPNLEDVLTEVSGCVLSIHDNTLDGITLCTDLPNSGVCSDCLDEDQQTILGIGPAWYWEECITLQTKDDEIVIDPDTGLMVENDVLSNVPPPSIGEYVTIYAYKKEDYDELVAFYVRLDRPVKNKMVTTFVLLRDQTTLAPLWRTATK